MHGMSCTRALGYLLSLHWTTTAKEWPVNGNSVGRQIMFPGYCTHNRTLGSLGAAWVPQNVWCEISGFKLLPCKRSSVLACRRWSAANFDAVVHKEPRYVSSCLRM